MKLCGWITVAGWLVQAQQEFETMVSEGKTVELRCPHVSRPPVLWQRYQKTGSLVSLLDHSEDGRFSLAVDNSSLTVQRARPEDSGWYLCQGKRAEYLKVRRRNQPGDSEDDQTEDTPPTSSGSTDHWSIPVGVAGGMAVGMAVGVALVLLIQRKHRSR
ncbi:unnamed protein product [Lota lota]